MKRKSPYLLFQAVVSAVAAFLLVGCAGTAVAPPAAAVAEGAPNGVIVEHGDLARVRYTARDTHGAIVASHVRRWTSSAASADALAGDPMSGDPEAVLAGSSASFPGIADSIVGMHLAQHRTIELPAARAFGNRHAKDVVQLPREQTLPETMQVPTAAFVHRFGGDPALDREVDVLPSIRGRVEEIGETVVTLRLVGDEGAAVSRPFGTTQIHQDETGVHVRFDPILGSEIPMQGRKGRIVAADDQHVTVDFNHPRAGEDFVLELEVISVTKAATFAEWTIPWVADQARGLDEAAAGGRPVVLLLYADWCPYCQRLLREVLVDPRITDLRDRFVWVKVNSDIHQEYKRAYDQTGFPLIVVLGSGGKVISRLDGFRDPVTLRDDLLSAIGPGPHA
jgi:FKBP-type peptidyl-prolyl cis-trans isomerase 2